MAVRSEILIGLIQAEHRGDHEHFHSLVKLVSSEERRKGHHSVADRIDQVLDGKRRAQERKKAPANVPDLLEKVEPTRSIESLAMSDDLRRTFRELIEEYGLQEALRKHGLEPRNRVLLSGPPGNGKTTTAEALAKELGLPMYTIRYENIMSGFLGETTSRINKAFEFASTHNCVLFFDELETLVKERSDDRDVGEMKRIVSVLLLQIDKLPNHVLLVGATNHSEMLDRAVWRRFQIDVELPSPTRERAVKFLGEVMRDVGVSESDVNRAVDALGNTNYSVLEDFGKDVMRRCVILGKGDPAGVDVPSVIQDQLHNRQKRG